MEESIARDAWVAAFERLLGNGDRSSTARNSRSRVAPNVALSMDLVSDQTASGQRFRALTVVDVFSRECLAIEPGRSLAVPISSTS
jgi:transposase InsO family protein